MSLALASRRAAISPAWVKNPLWRTARAVPSLDQPFADTKSLVDAVTGQSLVTFTRASSGTSVGSDGVLRTAAVNEPRFDHNPTTGESLGLLVEEQRTNLLLRSEEFGTTWSTLNAVVSSNSSTSPNAASTADTLTPDASSAAHLISQSTAVTASIAYTASVFVKGDGAAFAQVAYDNGASVGAFVNVNLSTGAITRGPELAGGATNATGSVVALANGWYRITVGATHSGTIGRILVSPLPSGQSSAGLNPITTTTTGDKIVLWGAQLEAGAFPTSYIPTTTAAATRNADVASITGTAFSSWYRQDEGTVYGDFIRTASTNSQQGRVFSFSDGTNTNQLEIYQTGGSNPSAQITVTTLQAQWITSNFAIGAPTREVLGYQLNNTNASFNGSAETTDTVCTMPTALTQARIGDRQDGIRTLNGTIRRLCYWGQRLPDSILQTITR